MDDRPYRLQNMKQNTARPPDESEPDDVIGLLGTLLVFDFLVAVLLIRWGTIPAAALVLLDTLLT